MVPRGPDDVTAAWLSSHLGPVTIDEVTRIGAEHGFVSCVLRVRGSAAGAPLDLAVKLTEAERTRREGWFLGSIAPLTPVPLPRLRLVEHDRGTGQGALAMDHVAGSQGDVLVAVARTVASQLIDQLARLHHRWPDAAAELDPVRSVEPPRFVVRPERLAAVLTHRGDALDEVATARLRAIADRAPAAHGHLLAGPRTLVHGDVHLDNVLLVEGRPLLLDWESARVGTPAEDLARIVLTRTDPPVVDVDEVVEEYRAAVTAPGGTVDPSLGERVRSAVIALCAGTLNWVGGSVEETPADDRRRRVVDGALHDVLRVVAMLDVPPRP